MSAHAARQSGRTGTALTHEITSHDSRHRTTIDYLERIVNTRIRPGFAFRDVFVYKYVMSNYVV